jgi:hypothetical protein
MQMYIVYALQLIIAIGLINVWVVRFNKPTQYRGRGASNMTDEFAAYGLPKWFMYLVGAGKIFIAALMIIGFWVPMVVCPASALLVLLMIGAVAMHIKVRDPFIRMVPALLMLAMAVTNVILTNFI